MNAMARWVGRGSWLLFLGVGFLGLFAVPWGYDLPYVVSLLIAVALAIVALVIARTRRPVADASEGGQPLALAAIILLGVLLRLGWVALVPPVQLSDAHDYLDAVDRLLDTGEYGFLYKGHLLLAWRPPGYPLLLAGVTALVGTNPWVPAALNLLLFSLNAWFTAKIAAEFGGWRAGHLAALLLALWPSDVTLSGLALTEPLSLFLLTFTVWATLKGGTGGAVGAGLATGLGILVRPSLLLFPLIWLVKIVMAPGERIASLKWAALASLCAALVVAPWTLRNLAVLGEPVVVSTNGGDVFYRANNPLATGTWTARGERDLDRLLHDELHWNRTGFSWGKEWIAAHPGEFVWLSLKKMSFFLGDDASGIYWALHRGYGHQGWWYQGLTTLCNLWWVALWMLALAGALVARRFFVGASNGPFFLLAMLYLVAVHSVFESQSRYHQPLLGLIGVLASVGVRGARRAAAAPGWPIIAPFEPFVAVAGGSMVEKKEFYAQVLEIFFVCQRDPGGGFRLLSLKVEGSKIVPTELITDAPLVKNIAGVGEPPLAHIEMPLANEGDVWNSPTLAEGGERQSAFKRLLPFSIRHLPVLEFEELCDSLRRGSGRLPLRELLLAPHTPPWVVEKLRAVVQSKLNISLERITGRAAVRDLGIEQEEVPAPPPSGGLGSHPFFQGLEEPVRGGEVDEHGRASDGGRFLGVRVQRRKP